MCVCVHACTCTLQVEDKREQGNTDTIDCVHILQLNK